MSIRKAWTIRKARPEDLARVRILLAEADLFTEGVEDQFPGGFVVAEGDGEVVGVAGIEVYGEYGLLRSLVVDPAWRGNGIGRTLTRTMLETTKALGLKAAYLLTMTVEAWLAPMGFVRVDRKAVPAGIRGSKEFSGICPQNAVCMQWSEPL